MGGRKAPVDSRWELGRVNLPMNEVQRRQLGKHQGPQREDGGSPKKKEFRNQRAGHEEHCQGEARPRQELCLV